MEFPLRALICKKNISARTDDELEGDVECLEAVGYWSAWVLIIGLVLEVLFAILAAAHQLMLGRWGDVFCTFFVALGVIGEVVFGKKANERQRELADRAKRREKEMRANIDTAKVMAFLGL